MNLEQDGFLAADISECISENRKANAAWFELAYGLNRLAQRQLLSLSVDGGDMQAMLVAVLYARGLTNFQGAVLLVERGLVLGARILARSCFEDVFYLGAVQSSPEYYQRLLHADQLVRKKIARALLNLDQPVALDPEDADKLNGFLAALPEDLKGQPDPITKVAADAALGPLYETYYRALSNDAAHPSIVSLSRHIDEDRPTFLWGPEPDQVPDTIEAACTAVIYLITGLRSQLGQNDDAVFKMLRDQHQSLIKLAAGSLRT